MSRKRSARQWHRQHQADPYVREAQAGGYRSRAIYKLMELDRRDRLFQSGMTVIDLGAAPGAWSQYAQSRVGPKGRVLALDRLPMDPIEGVTHIEGDFTEESTLAEIQGWVESHRVDLVMSDMAPNMSGVDAVDQPRSIHLVELALDLAERVLDPGGRFVAKAFQGEGFDALVRTLRGTFRVVAIRKPDASRDRSREVYLVARNLATPKRSKIP
jgi:23S rRNA (uridine2552-2'-O)-methyltransferase